MISGCAERLSSWRQRRLFEGLNAIPLVESAFKEHQLSLHLELSLSLEPMKKLSPSQVPGPLLVTAALFEAETKQELIAELRPMPELLLVCLVPLPGQVLS